MKGGVEKARERLDLRTLEDLPLRSVQTKYVRLVGPKESQWLIIDMVQKQLDKIKMYKEPEPVGLHP